EHHPRRGRREAAARAACHGAGGGGPPRRPGVSWPAGARPGQPREAGPGHLGHHDAADERRRAGPCPQGERQHVERAHHPDERGRQGRGRGGRGRGLHRQALRPRRARHPDRSLVAQAEGQAEGL
ncbi:MAG: hypothetical protein AVDCRST_MAG77-4483, partial [uncultured Chloroflexi bacterium]